MKVMIHGFLSIPALQLRGLKISRMVNIITEYEQRTMEITAHGLLVQIIVKLISVPDMMMTMYIWAAEMIEIFYSLSQRFPEKI